MSRLYCDPPQCSVEGCGRQHSCHGLCGTHARHMRKYGRIMRSEEQHANGKIKNPSTCKVEGCLRPFFAKGYCAAHYERVRINGNIGDSPIKGERKARSIRKSGYVWIYVPAGTPNAYKPNLGPGDFWTIEEHRFVMQQILGRPLLPDESVHHKNGIRDDNQPGNLELWVRSQPYGARASDLVEWAREVLRRYDQKPVLRLISGDKDDVS